MNTQFKKGQIPWNKGKPMSESSKNKMKDSLKKIRSSRKKTAYWKGKELPFETRKKMSEKRKGEQHWNWQGGKDRKKHRLNRRTFEYQEWRKAVFKRDKYTCVICQKTNCYVEADHIKKFADYPELRLEISNGRTLCLPCHRKTETWGNKKLRVCIDT